MEYNDKNKPLQCFMTQSTCYKGTGKMAVKGVLWHSTGANNPTLKRYVQPDDNAANKDEILALIGKNTNGNDWNHIVRQAGLNCWIGKLADGTIATIQTMPWDYKPWGCGSGSKGSCNNGWIQFEICEDGLTDSAFFKKVYDEACEITAYLCKMFGIDPNGTVKVNGVSVPTILCHADSCKLGLGSNHGDVNHWFPKHGKSMATARVDVAALLGVVDKPPVVVTPTPPTTTNTFTPRLTAPSTTDKHWLHSSCGGLNECILISGKSTIPNCVGYAWGRFYEIIGSRPKLSRRNAEDWYGYTADGYARGTVPKLGAVICWRKGTVGNQSDGAGHVAIVEQIKANGDIVTSNSGYKSTRFWKKTFTKASGYSLGSAYTFQGFIYPPISFENSATQDETTVSYLVRITASVLNIRKQPTTNSGITGTIRGKGIYTIVGEASGAGAKRWGKLKSGAGWISLDYTQKI